MLHKALLAFAAPKRQAATKATGEALLDEVVRRPSPERMGDAFCELLERLPADQVPQLGGLKASIVVTMYLESLVGGLAPATLDNGGVISAATARRLACEAG